MQHRDDHGAEAGFGLVEVMVSMVIFALLMAAAIPLFITSIRVTAKNSSIAYATQLVNEGIEVARGAVSSGDCTDLSDALDALPDGTDGRGVTFDVTGTVDDCTGSGSLATVTVSTSTSAASFANPVATAETRIFVKAP